MPFGYRDTSDSRIGLRGDGFDRGELDNSLMRAFYEALGRARPNGASDGGSSVKRGESCPSEHKCVQTRSEEAVGRETPFFVADGDSCLSEHMCVATRSEEALGGETSFFSNGP